MLIFLRSILIFIVLFPQVLFAQLNLQIEIDKIEKIKDFNTQEIALSSFYSKNTKDGIVNKNESLIINFVIKLANTQAENNNLVEAFYILDKAYRSLFHHLKDSNLKKDFIYFYAYYSMTIHENKQAIELLTTKSIDLQQVVQEDVKSIILLTKLYIQTGDFQQAIFWCKEGLFLINYDKNHKNYLGLMSNQTHCYVQLNKHKEVLENSRKIANLILNYPNYAPLYYTNLGLSYLNNKQYNQARECFSKSKKVNLNELANLLVDDVNIATSYHLEGEYIKSIKLLEHILVKIKTYYPNLKTVEVAALYQAQANNYFANHDFNKGNFNYSKALFTLNFNGSLKSYNGNLVSLFSVVLDKVKFNTKEQQYDLQNIYQADSLIDLMRQEHTEQDSKLFWREKTRAFYENAIETCFKLKNPEKAFYFMEKSRAILLLDALKDLDASKILREEQLTTERSLRYAMIGLQNKLETISEQDKNYKNYFQQLIEAKEKHHAFIKSLETSNPNYYNLKYNNEYVSLQQIQAELKTSKQAFVQYFVGENAVYALCIKASSIDLKKINLQSFQNLSLKYLQLSAHKPPHTIDDLKQIQAVSFSLYQLIFEPFHVTENRLVVSQDNVFIPFEALCFNQKSNQILLQKYAISYTYSANVLMRKQDKSAKSWFRQNDLLGFAPQTFQKNLELNSLMGSDKMLQKIENDYFAGKTYFNQEATKENFIQNASEYGIIQLFTHGKADTTNDESKIYFYDKSLSINELYQMNKLKASLVVLSACETNLGQNATGEGVMSFARGFAYLNVPTTISTLWSVNNQSTYRLTELFYQYLKSGLAKDEALQKAKLDYLKNSGNVYPYYWSGMVLIGDASANQPSYLWVLICLVSLIFGGLCLKWHFR